VASSAAVAAGARKRIVLVAMIACLVLVSAAIALSRGGSGDTAKLVLQRAQSAGTGNPELLVSVERSINVAQTAGGSARVGLECRDQKGDVALRAEHPWPFIDDGSTPLPHVHQPASTRELDQIRSCRITGTEVRLEATLPPKR
jgi:hypothetical protein